MEYIEGEPLQGPLPLMKRCESRRRSRTRWTPRTEGHHASRPEAGEYPGDQAA